MKHSWILLLAMIGHVLCVYADRLLLCTPGGQFGFSDMKDNARMARLFVTKPESDPLRSIVLGTLAMFLQFFGYLALGIWMRPYSALWANLMIVGAAMIYTFGLAHHILGCAAEWIYIKSDHTETGLKLTNDFFSKTSATMIGCYAGILLLSVAHFIPVMENIRLGKHGATDEEVIRAAQAANCEEFVSKLLQGYDTPIGENGAKLSGGERQRISIARALLKNAPIVLLDEATASLDVENETRVQGALSRLLQGKTVLVIAHRMRTVEAADHIVVLADGKVAEEGRPEDLLQKNGGIFRRMTELQTASAAWSI